MPYHIKVDNRKKKKYLIVRDEDGVVVGSSDSRVKAGRSIGYRMDAEHIKAKVNKAYRPRK
jgi:hypothetical protein